MENGLGQKVDLSRATFLQNHEAWSNYCISSISKHLTNLYFKFQLSSFQWTGENWYRVCSVMEKLSRPESRTISTRATFLQNHETWSRVLLYLSISKHVTNLYFKFQVSSFQWTGENWYRVWSVMEKRSRPESRTISTRATFLLNHETWSRVLLYLSISKHVTNLYFKFQVSSFQWTGENWYRVWLSNKKTVLARKSNNFNSSHFFAKP